MMQPSDRYENLRAAFRWELPAELNMAHQCLSQPMDRTALYDLEHGPISYAELHAKSAALARAMSARGVMPGDRVGVLRSQDAWTAAAHLAIWSLGAISVPLFTLFQAQALDARTSDADVALIITDAANAERQMTAPALIPDDLPVTSGETLACVATGPETPACLIYTSGTTGAPKGALHGHRMLTGHLPGVIMSHDSLGQEGDCLWTPADWAWIGGLFDVLMPGLALGVPVVAARLPKFTPEACQKVLQAAPIRNVFFPPTALRLLKAQDVQLKGLRSVASGGEPLGAEMLDWGKQALGLNINEFYGQTECNMVASSSSELFAPRPNCIGKPVPGFELAVLDAEGKATSGEGEVAIRCGAASMMLEYWGKPEETAAKYRGDWMLTGDRGIWEGSYLRFIGREDDVITSAGYRIGPAEVEDCLLSHAAVATVGVIGKPDALRTEIVKAYVVLKPDYSDSDVLKDELQSFVKQRLTSYAYPREIEFLQSLPMTVTGKVIRKELKARASAEMECSQ